MPLIHLTTFIKAPIERVFDLSRSIDLHKRSMVSNGEKAVAGTVSGLINKGETVTFIGKHLFKTRVHVSEITAMTIPYHFIDEMKKGDFKFFKHEHHFKKIENGVLMIDLLQFETPYALLGKMVNRVYLYNYLKQLLETRNQVIKDFAETEKWKHVL